MALLRSFLAILNYIKPTFIRNDIFLAIYWRQTGSRRILFASKPYTEPSCHYNHMTRACQRREMFVTIGPSQTLQTSRKVILQYALSQKGNIFQAAIYSKYNNLLISIKRNVNIIIFNYFCFYKPIYTTICHFFFIPGPKQELNVF